MELYYIGEDAKGNEFFSDLPYVGYVKHQGQYQVEITGCDTTNALKKDGYLTLFYYDKKYKRIGKADFKVKTPSNLEEPTPLGQLVDIFLEENRDNEDINFEEVTFDLLVGVECQLVVEKMNGSYEVTHVYP